MANKAITIKVAPDEIMYSSISKSRDGYNSARMVSKVSEKVYMTVSVEWESDDTVPSFAMDLMDSLKAHEIKPNEVVGQYKDEYAALQKRQED